MPGPRQPINLLLAKGKKHLTKTEIQSRKKNEVKASTNKVLAPPYLPENLKTEFNRIAKELMKSKIITNLDCEALARFIIADYEFQQVTIRILKLKTVGPRFFSMLNAQEKLLKMARSSAIDLGLTISSRCKLVIPEEEKKVNPLEAKGFGNI